MHHIAGHNLSLNFEEKMTSLFGRKGRSNNFGSGEGGGWWKIMKTYRHFIFLYICIYVTDKKVTCNTRGAFWEWPPLLSLIKNLLKWMQGYLTWPHTCRYFVQVQLQSIAICIQYNIVWENLSAINRKIVGFFRYHILLSLCTKPSLYNWNDVESHIKNH